MAPSLSVYRPVGSTSPPPLPVHLVGTWYEGFFGALLIAVIAAIAGLLTALLVFYLQRGADRRRLASTSQSEAAEALTVEAFSVSNAMTHANRLPGTAWIRSQARFQAQRPFDASVLAKAPNIRSETVLGVINDTQRVLGEYLQWVDEEDRLFDTVIDHVAGPDAPQSLADNPAPMQAWVRVARQFQYLTEVLAALRKDAALPSEPILPDWPEHTSGWDNGSPAT